MPPKLLNKAEIAERFSTNWKKAASLLASYGVNPVDLGRGKGGGARWLESAVNSVLLRMHEESAPKPDMQKDTCKKPLHPMGKPLYELSVDEVYSFIHSPSKNNLENQKIVQ